MGDAAYPARCAREREAGAVMVADTGAGTEWLPMDEAADRLGVSVDTVKRRRKAGQLRGQHEQTPSGYRWLVEVPARARAGAASESNTADAPGHAPADALELATLRAEVAGLREVLSQVAAERDRAYRRIEVLERLAERAQLLQERAQPAQLPSGATESGTRAADASAGDTTHSGPREGLRERVRRLWRGGR